MALTFLEIGKIVSQVEFEDWTIRLDTDDATSLEAPVILQVEFEDEDIDTGRVAVQKGRKWLISHHATESEIVQTCLKAILTAAEHEVRERFKYKGFAVFGPHCDVNSLVGIAQQKRPDLRLHNPE